ncbi:MAG TPA: DedA family protein [Patescibacteria group bacterium]|nr:DedA family protein [Patescibacteria group bacterium]
MLNSFIDWIMLLVEQLDYWNIALLMTIESSFVPFPSELVIPPAAYLAQQGQLSIILVVIFGVLGSLLGALINYILALTLGRKILYNLVKTKIAKSMLITEAKLEKSEAYFLKHGERSTFFGRLVPVIRQLISIPAGLAKMNIFKFCLYTFLGSSVWIIILALTGYYFAKQQELIFLYYKEIVFFILLIVLVILFIKNRKVVKKKKLQKSQEKESNIINTDSEEKINNSVTD